MTPHFSVKIYGCRGSFPVAGAAHQRYGGHTSCVVVTAGSRELILDAGSGLFDYSRALMARYSATRAPIQSHLFLTHMHLDHLMGLPFFAPMYMADATIDVWGPRMGDFDSLEACVGAIMHPPFFPVPLHEMSSIKRFHDISEAHSVYFLKDQEAPLLLRARHPQDAAKLPAPDQVEVAVHCMRGFNHPKNGVLLYKVVYQGKSVVYATDTEGYVQVDQRLLQFARGASVLIHDAMYTAERYVSMPVPTQGYGHSTVEIACEVAEQAGAERLVLFHHDPTNDDAALDAIHALGQSCFPRALAAHDGLTLDIDL